MNTQYTVTIFELGGCCSTSLTDPAHYSQLNELEKIQEQLKQKEITLMRINAALKPDLLHKVPDIEDYLQNKGVDVFPITVVGGKIVKEKSYPTGKEIDEWLENQNKK